MIAILNRRELLATIQRIVKSSEPDVNDFIAACDQLGEVFTDSLGIPCKVRIAIDMQSIKEITKEH